jgi:hypothetical protein
MSNSVSLSFAYDEISGLGLRVLKQLGVPLTPLSDCDWSEENPILFFQNNKNSLEKIIDDFPNFRLIFTDHSHLAKLLKLKLNNEYANKFVYDKYLPHTEIAINSEVLSIELPLPHTQLGNHRDLKGSIIPGSGIIELNHGDSRIVSFPWDLSKSPESLAEKNFSVVYRLQQGMEIEELGSVFDLTTLRMVMLDVLKDSFFKLNLPFVHVSYRTREHYICFRLDADGFSPESTESCLAISGDTGFRFTWFINVNDWRANMAELKSLVRKSQEVQSHGFFHMIFNSYLSNALNLGLAKLYMGLYKIKVTASSSPLGLWNRKYLKSQRLCRLNYSSEFALGVEGLPFYPFNDERNPLQIPSNNISVGLFEPLSPRTLIEMWQKSVRRQLNDKGVAVIYDHPFRRLEKIRSEVTQMLLDYKSQGVKSLTLSEYHKMWLSRPSLNHARLCEGLVSYGFETGRDSQEFYPVRTYTSISDSVELPDFKEKSLSPPIVNFSSGKYEELQRTSFVRFAIINARDVLISWRRHLPLAKK